MLGRGRRAATPKPQRGGRRWVCGTGLGQGSRAPSCLNMRAPSSLLTLTSPHSAHLCLCTHPAGKARGCVWTAGRPIRKGTGRRHREPGARCWQLKGGWLHRVPACLGTRPPPCAHTRTRARAQEHARAHTSARNAHAAARAPNHMPANKHARAQARTRVDARICAFMRERARTRTHTHTSTNTHTHTHTHTRTRT